MSLENEQAADIDVGAQQMPRNEDPLVLYGHRIVPTAKHEGSVRRWMCLDCEREAEDAESYLHRECEE